MIPPRLSDHVDIYEISLRLLEPAQEPRQESRGNGLYLEHVQIALVSPAPSVEGRAREAASERPR